MDSERWNLVSGILGEAMELPERERDAFLADRCGSDAALRREVEALMTASERGGLLPANPDARQVDLLGKTIGRYRVEELIGSGGMGRVYKGTDMELGRTVALKVLAEDSRLDFHAVARFRREARLLASLNHPNIAAIYDLEEWEGQSVLILEFVEGPTLEAHLAGHGAMSSADTVQVAIQIARALKAAHQRGIVHRDLKPANVVLTPSGAVKILDFGIAKPVLQPDPPQRGTHSLPRLAETVAGWRVGTPAYMSPEQVRGSKVDQRADCWAFGAILFQMVTGTSPFRGEDTAERLKRILEESPEWDRLPASVPGNLRSLIERCLVKDPDRRLQSVDDALTTLERATRGEREGIDGTLRGLRAHPVRTAASLVLALALALSVVRFLPSTRPIPSEQPARVLVLPFQFLGDPTNAYVAQGISEEISHRLSGLTNLMVLGRQTAVYASNRSMAPTEMADELGADFLLEGTVRLQQADGGARLRIRTALTDTESLTELWSETHDSPADDVFGVQEEVAARVAEALGVELPRSALAGDFDTPDLEAYDYYLRGNEYSRRSELESSMRSALELYEAATLSDPGFAAAWAAASIMRSRLRWRGYDPSDENLRLAKTAGDRALALDPSEGYAHLALGYYHYYGFRNYEEAFESFTAAAALRPNDPEVRYAVGVVARRMGNWDVAVDALTRTLAANPRNAEMAITLGETYIALGRFEQAARYLDRAIAIAPDRPGAYLFKSWLSLSSSADAGLAVDAISEGWDLAGGPRVFELLGRYISDMDWWLTRALAGNERYRQMFAAANLPALGVDSAAYYLHTAQFHDVGGDTALARAYSDSARIVLERRIAQHGKLSRQETSVAARAQQAGRLAHLAIAYAGLGRIEDALRTAEEGVDVLPEDADALHGSEIVVQRGLVQALAGDSEGAIATFAEVFASPSSFRPGMLRHDPVLAPLLEDARLQQSPR